MPGGANKDLNEKEPGDSGVRVVAALVPKINLAFYQNSVSTLRELTIVNESVNTLKNVKLVLETSSFFQSKSWHVNVISPGEQRSLNDLDVSFDSSLLSSLTEAETTVVSFKLYASDTEVASLKKSIGVLARNQWGGIGHMPEIVAAFVQPNDPVVERILKKAAMVLRENGKDPALNGYKGGPKHAWELASAIWSAVGSPGLDYSLPPASFETQGQKIRGPEQIYESKIATCLDITLLFCAAIEQCGLNPLILFTKEHALAGVWLKDEEFTTAIVDDITALRKREKLEELLLFETTLITNHPCASFRHAIDDHSFGQWGSHRPVE